jgi:hypothetical protein
MFISHKINLGAIHSGSTATTINIPINMEYQFIDQSELLEQVFVPTEIEKAINPILDYEKVRFSPKNTGSDINIIRYNLNLDGKTTYESIGFTDEDIKYGKENFKQTYLNLNFYDTDNPLDQNLISNITLFSLLKPTDLYQSGATSNYGTVKPSSEIFLNFDIENPIKNPRGFAEGFYIYDYKDELNIGDIKYLYMRGSFKNAKTGKNTNLMIQNTADTIDNIINKLYTRYKLTRDNTGYYYEIDNTYSNNITYTSNDVTVNLYQLKVL